MVVMVASIVVTVVFYTIITYLSYIATFILLRGVKYRLLVPTVRIASFILVCYISIISDILLFSSTLYHHIVLKNGLLLILIVASLHNA